MTMAMMNANVILKDSTHMHVVDISKNIRILRDDIFEAKYKGYWVGQTNTVHVYTIDIDMLICLKEVEYN